MQDVTALQDESSSSSSEEYNAPEWSSDEEDGDNGDKESIDIRELHLCPSPSSNKITPHDRCCHTATSVDNSLYIIGGRYNEEKYFNDVRIQFF